MKADQVRVRQEAEPVPPLPPAETRGGTDPDWDRAKPGEALPEKPEPELHDPPGEGDG
jgi:hypothetical protein